MEHKSILTVDGIFWIVTITCGIFWAILFTIDNSNERSMRKKVASILFALVVLSHLTYEIVKKFY